MREPSLGDLEIHDADCGKSADCGCNGRDDDTVIGDCRGDGEGSPGEHEGECDEDPNAPGNTPTS